MQPNQGGLEPSRAAVHILSVPKVGYAIVAFAGPYRGIMMHWARGGSVPCLPGDDCPPALHRSGSTWKGYAPVRSWDHTLGAWVPYALEITEALEEILRGRDLRGEVWRLSRQRKKNKPGTVQGTLEETRSEPALLHPFDVRPVIQRRYHCAELVWDVPNPIVPKLTVETTVALPPTSLPLIDPYRSTKPAAASPPGENFVPIGERIRARALAPEQVHQTNGVHDGD